MSLLMTMLPFYLLGNLHCIGMCGPLVMMIGQHRFRFFYFLGRGLSFAFAGMAAGEAGAVLDLFFKHYHISALTCFIFGSVILGVGMGSLLEWRNPVKWFVLPLARFQNSLALLILRDQAWPTFLFGFFTIALPCGQTVVVFAACAVSGDPWVGLLNGGVFALLTSPSLFLAMKARALLQSAKRHYHTITGVCALVIGFLTLCRGFAELDLISHFVLNPKAPAAYHLVLY